MQRKPIATPYARAIRVGTVVQLVLLVPNALVLDGGQILGLFLVALLVQWLATAMIICRRPTPTSKLDVLFIRYGILLLAPVAWILAPLIWLIIGESTQSGLHRLLH